MNETNPQLIVNLSQNYTLLQITKDKIQATNRTAAFQLTL